MVARGVSGACAASVLCVLVAMAACSADAASDAQEPSLESWPTSPPAQRPSYFHVDRTKDLVAIRGEQYEEEARPAPGLLLGDIRDIRLEHTATQVRVAVRFRGPAFATDRERAAVSSRGRGANRHPGRSRWPRCERRLQHREPTDLRVPATALGQFSACQRYRDVDQCQH